MKDLRAYRKANDLCINCGNEKDRVGYYCARCNTMYNTLKRQHANKYHEAGRCTNCGTTMDREGWFCKACVKKLALRGRIRSEERRMNGECVQCGTYIGIDIGSYCRRCLDQLKERRARKAGE